MAKDKPVRFMEAKTELSEIIENIAYLAENNLNKSDSEEFDVLIHLMKNAIMSAKSVVAFLRALFEQPTNERHSIQAEGIDEHDNSKLLSHFSRKNISEVLDESSLLGDPSDSIQFVETPRHVTKRKKCLKSKGSSCSSFEETLEDLSCAQDTDLSLLGVTADDPLYLSLCVGDVSRSQQGGGDTWNRWRGADKSGVTPASTPCPNQVLEVSSMYGDKSEVLAVSPMQEKSAVTETGVLEVSTPVREEQEVSRVKDYSPCVEDYSPREERIKPQISPSESEVVNSTKLETPKIEAEKYEPRRIVQLAVKENQLLTEPLSPIPSPMDKVSTLAISPEVRGRSPLTPPETSCQSDLTPLPSAYTLLTSPESSGYTPHISSETSGHTPLVSPETSDHTPLISPETSGQVDHIPHLSTETGGFTPPMSPETFHTPPVSPKPEAPASLTDELQFLKYRERASELVEDEEGPQGYLKEADTQYMEEGGKTDLKKFGQGHFVEKEKGENEGSISTTELFKKPNKRDRRVQFNSSCPLYLFCRTQGWLSVPNTGGSTLGMAMHHDHRDDVPLRDREEEIAAASREAAAASRVNNMTVSLPIMEPSSQEESSGKRRSSRRSTIISTKSTSGLSMGGTRSKLKKSNGKSNLVSEMDLSPEQAFKSETNVTARCWEQGTIEKEAQQEGRDWRSTLTQPGVIKLTRMTESLPDMSKLAPSPDTSPAPTCSMEGSRIGELGTRGLTRIKPRRRRQLLKESGVEPDPEEGRQLDKLRKWRGEVGCRCVGSCSVEGGCECAIAGIQCQEEARGSPCACSEQRCGNPNGRYKFDQTKVEMHYIETIMEGGFAIN